MSLVMKDDEREVDVTAEDQAEINKFSRLNTKFHELERILGEKKDLLQTSKDCSDELMMLMDDDAKIKFSFGSTFVEIPKDEAEERVEKQTEDLEDAVEELEGQIKTIQEEMGAMKSILYAKFGRTINLEED